MSYVQSQVIHWGYAFQRYIIRNKHTHTHQDADFSSCPSLLTLPCGAQFCIIKCSGEMNTESQCKTHVQYSCSFCQNTFTRNPWICYESVSDKYGWWMHILSQQIVHNNLTLRWAKNASERLSTAKKGAWSCLIWLFPRGTFTRGNKYFIIINNLYRVMSLIRSDGMHTSLHWHLISFTLS